MATPRIKPQSKPKAITDIVIEKTVVESQLETLVVGEVVSNIPVEFTEEEPNLETYGEVVRETVHQLGIFSDYIYNLKFKDAVIVVENLGFGDVYLSSEGVAKVGFSQLRLLFGESMKFEGVEVICFTSASQPVVQILEIM